MIHLPDRFIHDDFLAPGVLPEDFDHLLSRGWRHFGDYFFRYNLAFHAEHIRIVIPLRIRLDGFAPSESQRRVLRKNADLDVTIRPAAVTDEAEELFFRHRRRFVENVPDSIRDLIPHDDTPGPGFRTSMLEARLDERLLAVGFFDVGAASTSGIYTAFDPAESSRSLGIFVILKEIEAAQRLGLEHYYQGYCYHGPSFYDYKKRFAATEAFDWNGSWHTYKEEE